MTVSKKHHYVPQSLLRKFSIDDEKKQIYVFDKLQKSSFSSSIVNAACENNFNILTINDEKINFEHLFQENDDKLAELITKINADKHLNGLSNNNKNELCYIVAKQIVRTKMYRTSMLSSAEQLSKTLKDFGIDPSEVSNFNIPSDSDIRKATLGSLLNTDQIASALNNKQLILIHRGKNECFWISDNPVVRHNAFPYGEFGLNSPGIEIYFPISSKLVIGFFCPSIIIKLDTALNSKEEYIDKKLYTSMFEGINKGEAISMGETTVTYLNSLQIGSSSRFLYAAENDFSLAERIIDKNPEATNIKTLMKIGKMGHAPKPKTSMPKGMWVVAYGNTNHYMLPVSKLNNKSYILEFETKDLELLQIILKDQPLQQVVLFQDGQERKGMRKVKFEVNQIGAVAKIKVKHIDDMLNNIIEKMK